MNDPDADVAFVSSSQYRALAGASRRKTSDARSMSVDVTTKKTERQLREATRQVGDRSCSNMVSVGGSDEEVC